MSASTSSTRGRLSRRAFAAQALGLVAGALGCAPRGESAPPSVAVLAQRTAGRSIALVSYMVRFPAVGAAESQEAGGVGFGGFLGGAYNGEALASERYYAEITPELRTNLEPYLTRLRHHAESSLNELWPVRPSGIFVPTAAYQELQTPPPKHVAPIVESYPMRAFGGDSSDSAYYDRKIVPSTVWALGRVTQTDLLVAIECDWGREVGTRSSFYGAGGELLYSERVARQSGSSRNFSDKIRAWVRNAELGLREQLGLDPRP